MKERHGRIDSFSFKSLLLAAVRCLTVHPNRGARTDKLLTETRPVRVANRGGERMLVFDTRWANRVDMWSEYVEGAATTKSNNGDRRRHKNNGDRRARSESSQQLHPPRLSTPRGQQQYAVARGHIIFVEHATAQPNTVPGSSSRKSKSSSSSSSSLSLLLSPSPRPSTPPAEPSPAPTFSPERGNVDKSTRRRANPGPRLRARPTRAEFPAH